jgi:hypothetical protein
VEEGIADFVDMNSYVTAAVGAARKTNDAEGFTGGSEPL